MCDDSGLQETGSDKIFISYSRADRQRVVGLVGLLESLGHSVFMDQRSIQIGKRWQRELDNNLKKADVLIVFWTRHAARSEWVKWEYEIFDSQFPDRPLIPVLGDSTPLTDALAARQHSDFCPLINELLMLVRDMEDKGVSKRKIREAVAKRLQEEGIELTNEKRNKLFGMLGVIGLSSAPLHFTQLGPDLVADKLTGLPAAYLYTAGAAATAGVVVCHTLSDAIGGYDLADRVSNPATYPVPITLDQTGTDACDGQGMICVSVSRTKISDRNDRFFGYSTPPCSAKVVRVKSSEASCQRDYDTDFAVKGVVLRRSPEADEGVEDYSGQNSFCLGSSEEGRQGVYRYANCVKP